MRNVFETRLSDKVGCMHGGLAAYMRWFYARTPTSVGLDVSLEVIKGSDVFQVNIKDVDLLQFNGQYLRLICCVSNASSSGRRSISKEMQPLRSSYGQLLS